MAMQTFVMFATMLMVLFDFYGFGTVFLLFYLFFLILVLFSHFSVLSTADCQADLAKSVSEKHQSKFHGPKYVVGLDVLKADACYERVVARRRVQCWHKCFSTYLVISCHLRQGLDVDYSVLQNEDGRMESFGSCGRRGSCFQNISGKVVCLMYSFQLLKFVGCDICCF